MPSPVWGEGITCNCPGDEMGNHVVGAGTPVIRTHLTGRCPRVVGWGRCGPTEQPEWYCYGARMKSLASMAGPLTPLRRMVPPPVTVMTVFDPAVWVTLAAKVAAVIPSGRRSILS